MQRILLFLLLAIPSFVWGQQLPNASTFSETNYFFNPAMTAPFDYWEVAATYRQQWAGFNDAPRTAGVGVQYPFVDQNMSIGAFIMHDETMPIVSNAISFSYAYKIRTGLFRDDQLSLGLLGTFSEYQVDSRGIVVNDAIDSSLPSDEVSQIVPNAGFGIYYQSYSLSDFAENYFYLGGGVNQLFGSDLIFESDEDPTNIKRALHGNAIVGFRFIKDKLALEPSVWANYAHKNLYDINLGMKFEQYKTFWLGLAFSSSQTATLQAGVILQNDKFLKDGLLRIGTLATYNRGSAGQYQGLGYECYIAYRFEQD